MKKYIILGSLLVAGIVSAQVSIDKTETRGTSTLLDFNDEQEASGSARGIILPIVDTPSAQTVEGTLFLYAQTDRVVYKSATATVNMTDAAQSNYASPTIAENGRGAVIADGQLSTIINVPGVLKLQSSTKAMILPHVTSTDKIVNPEPGTMVFESATNSVAIFNGDQWYFWN